LIFDNEKLRIANDYYKGEYDNKKYSEIVVLQIMLIGNNQALIEYVNIDAFDVMK
jgi:hypothetical protein